MRSNYSPKLGIKIVIENIKLHFICNGYHCLFDIVESQFLTGLLILSFILLIIFSLLLLTFLQDSSVDSALHWYSEGPGSNLAVSN